MIPSSFDDGIFQHMGSLEVRLPRLGTLLPLLKILPSYFSSFFSDVWVRIALPFSTYCLIFILSFISDSSLFLFKLIPENDFCSQLILYF